MITKDEITRLQQMHGEAMISILTPMEEEYPASDKNPIIIKNLVRETENRLKDSYDPARVQALMQKIDGLTQEIDYEHTAKGIALFVSENEARIVHLPFAPKEVVSVGKTFHTRDLLYAFYRNPKYFVLSLNASNVRLFRGFGQRLEEIKTDFFPASYEGPERTEPTSRTLRTDVEYEVLEDKKIFLRNVEENLYEIIRAEKKPLFLLGEKELVSFIKSHDRIARFVKGEIQENLAHANFKLISERIWPVVDENQKLERDVHLANLQEMVGYGRYAGGVQDVWKATKLGQVMTLLVEQNFSAQARVKTDDELTLILGDSAGTPTDGMANWHDDVVDEIIEKVLSMDGEVIFIEDGKMAGHDHIGAVLRYNISQQS